MPYANKYYSERESTFSNDYSHGKCAYTTLDLPENFRKICPCQKKKKSWAYFPYKQAWVIFSLKTLSLSHTHLLKLHMKTSQKSF